jgi:hypothetical protein
MLIEVSHFIRLSIDDDIGMSDLVHAQLSYKSASATSRYRSVTMLTPSQQMTKDSRIQAKIAK